MILAVTGALFDLGMGVSGPLNGVVATALGYSAVYGAGAIASAIACVVVIAGMLRSRTLRGVMVSEAPQGAESN